MCHSNKQHLFVKEIKKKLPNQINGWIDEKEIIIGENIRTSIVKGIIECDFFLIIIDEYALKSDWVCEEINLALKKEKELGRTFFLPIVLDKEAWKSIDDPKIKTRKYLYCHDLNDSSIEAVSKELISEIFLWLCREFDNKNLKSNTEQIIEENKFKKKRAIFYDAYGYSVYRKDLFYYKLKIYPYKEYTNKKEYFVQLLTFDVKLCQNGSFTGIIVVNNNYAYYTIDIRNSEKEVKRKLYIILFLGDKSIEDLNIGFATYCISSRNMELAAGELIMQRVKNNLIPKNLPIEVCRYFQMKKPQLRTSCKPLLNLNDIVIEPEMDFKLSTTIGTYKLFFLQIEKQEKNLHQYKLVIKENYCCFINTPNENTCNIKVIDNNLHIILLNNKSFFLNNMIFPISSNPVIEGVYTGVNSTQTPNCGKIIIAKTNKKFSCRIFNKKQMSEFFGQEEGNRELYETLNK